jgi:hypothetical protein
LSNPSNPQTPAILPAEQLNSLRADLGRLDTLRAGDDEWDAEDIEDMTPVIPRIVESLLNRIEKEVERAAESEAAGLDAGALMSIRREAERLGLTPLVRALNGAVEGPFNHARTILKIPYVCSLYGQSATFA